MKTNKLSTFLPLVAGICLSLPVIPPTAMASPVALQQPTATFSQTYGQDFLVGTAIDGVANDGLAWGIYENDVTKSDQTSDQTAVFETALDVGFAGGSLLTLKLDQLFAAWGQHTLGRFRLSVTTDDRSLFADGLASGGDVTAKWIVLDPDTLVSANGATLGELEDHSILATGYVPDTDIYMVTATTSLTGITGVRLELLQDPSLPSNGPGRQMDNGNIKLSEFSMDIVPMEVPVDCSQKLAAVQAELAALQAQLTTCSNTLTAANETIQDLQNDILDLLLPLHLLTQDFRMTFNDPHFRIRGVTAVDQMQNLVAEILDLPRGQQQQLFIGLGGHKGKGKLVDPRDRPHR